MEQLVSLRGLFCFMYCWIKVSYIIWIISVYGDGAAGLPGKTILFHVMLD